jgi:uncharacterized small protein (TIGR04563 family)
MSDHRKKSIIVPAEMLAEMKAEAKRQSRSLSWVVQQAVRRALPRFAKLPTIDESTTR